MAKKKKKKKRKKNGLGLGFRLSISVRARVRVKSFHLFYKLISELVDVRMFEGYPMKGDISYTSINCIADITCSICDSCVLFPTCRITVLYLR